MSVVLQDEMVVLRPLVVTDAEEHLAGEDEELQIWLSGGPGTIEGVRRWIVRNAESWATDGPVRNFGIWDRASGLLAGNIEGHLGWETLDGLVEGDANIAYGLSPQWRGRSYATRSVKLMVSYLKHIRFADQPVQRAVIRVLPANIRSHWVAERCGFQADGEFINSDGELMLRFAYELTRPPE